MRHALAAPHDIRLGAEVGEYDADLETRCQCDECDGFAGLDPARFKLFDQRDRVRRRRRIPVPVDRDHGIVTWTVAEHFGHASLDELLLAVGYGKLDAEEVVQGMQAQAPDSEPPPKLKQGRIEQFVRRVIGKDHAGITVNGIDDVLVRYARCCNPLPGDGIIGFITRGRGVAVHRRECKKALDMDPERRVDVAWDSKAKINRPVQICVTTTNKPGILATVSQTFSAQSINISEANCRAGEDGHARNVFTFHCSDLAQLKGVMKALSRVSGVENFRKGSAVMSPCAPMYSAASGTRTWAWQSTVLVFSRIGSVETFLAAVGP